MRSLADLGLRVYWVLAELSIADEEILGLAFSPGKSANEWSAMIQVHVDVFRRLSLCSQAFFHRSRCERWGHWRVELEPGIDLTAVQRESEMEAENA